MSARKNGRAAATHTSTARPAAYGYIRVSGDTQAKSKLGLKAQSREITDYFTGLLKRKCRWAGVYSDPGTSASKVPFVRRPQLLSALKRGDHLIVAKLDRAFRDTLDLAQTLRRLESAGVTVHLLDIRVDTSTSAGRLIGNWRSGGVNGRLSDLRGR
jgi:DNA invertase Pin-like site-specific DNA recombinase